MLAHADVSGVDASGQRLRSALLSFVRQNPGSRGSRARVFPGCLHSDPKGQRRHSTSPGTRRAREPSPLLQIESSGSASSWLLRPLWAERPRPADEAGFELCSQLIWIVRSGRARCFRGRLLRTVRAGTARHRTDRLLAAVVASRAAASAARRDLIGHVVAASDNPSSAGEGKVA
eukprot:scaffold127375_cov69-Phaeocystis_antarctica.AAC.2